MVWIDLLIGTDLATHEHCQNAFVLIMCHGHLSGLVEFNKKRQRKIPRGHWWCYLNFKGLVGKNQSSSDNECLGLCDGDESFCRDDDFIAHGVHCFCHSYINPVGVRVQEKRLGGRVSSRMSRVHSHFSRFSALVSTHTHKPRSLPLFPR